MICPACTVDMHPSQSMTPAGLMPTCVACGAKLPSLLKAEPTPKPVAAAPALTAAPLPLAVPKAPVAIQDAPTDILGLTKARLATVRAGIAQLRALEAEERMLVAMVAAAESATNTFVPKVVN